MLASRGPFFLLPKLRQSITRCSAGFTPLLISSPNKFTELQRPLHVCGCCFKDKSDDTTDRFGSQNSNEKDGATIRQSLKDKYKPFEDQQRIVQDAIEETWEPLPEMEEQKPEKPLLPRGQTGVFDLTELVQLLREERAIDVCVITIPKELDYANYMVLVTSLSQRHMFSLATYIRKIFKSKRLEKGDVLPSISENKKSDDWIALDLGNIILHIFNPEFREKLNLETLWAVGREFDDLSHQKDTEIVQLLKMFQ